MNVSELKKMAARDFENLLQVRNNPSLQGPMLNASYLVLYTGL